MFRKLSALVAWVAFTHSSYALSDAGTEAFKKLTGAMRQEVEIASKEDPAKTNRHPDARTLESSIAQLEAAAASTEQRSYFEQTLNSYAGYFTSKEVIQAAAALKSTMLADRQKEENEEKNRLQAILDRTGKTLKEAKTPEELDGLLSDLSKNRRGEYRSSSPSEEIQKLGVQIESAKYYVEKWQDYLAAMKSSDRRAARQALNELKQNSREAGFFPRSEIIAMIDGLSASTEEIQKWILGIKTLDEIKPVIASLQQFKSDYDGSNANVQEYVRMLGVVDKSYRDYLNGLPTALEIDYQNYESVPQVVGSKIAELRSQLLKLVIPRYVDAPKDAVAKPEENVLQFLDRLAEEAKAREDAAVGLRIREARRILSRGSSYSSQDGVGLNAYVSGQNQETAGQFELAVVSYQQALKSGSDLVPAKTIGVRLEAIKEAHPDDYAKGFERFLAPVPQSNFPPGYSQFRQGDPRAKPANPAILIPAPKEDPAPEPKAEPKK